MAVQELLSTLAEVTLSPGFEIVFEAIDATTGLPVTGVTISNAAVYGDVPEAAPGPATFDDTVPLYTPLALDEQAQTEPVPA